MKFLVIILISHFSIADCLEDYKNSAKNELEHIVRKRKIKKNAMSSDHIVTASYGSMLKYPSRDHIFEIEVLRSAGINYEYSTTAVMDIYKEFNKTFTLKEIKKEFLLGLTSGDFCKKLLWVVPKKKNINDAKRYVIKSLKSRINTIHNKDEEVVDENNLKEKNQPIEERKFKIQKQ